MKMNLHELELKSWDLRRDVVDIIMAGGGGHIGGDMSVLNTLLVLYKNHLRITPETTADPNRDRGRGSVRRAGRLRLSGFE